jgi:hypothetical protein
MQAIPMAMEFRGCSILRVEILVVEYVVSFASYFGRRVRESPGIPDPVEVGTPEES